MALTKFLFIFEGFLPECSNRSRGPDARPTTRHSRSPSAIDDFLAFHSIWRSPSCYKVRGDVLYIGIRVAIEGVAAAAGGGSNDAEDCPRSNAIFFTSKSKQIIY